MAAAAALLQLLEGEASSGPASPGLPVPAGSPHGESCRVASGERLGRRRGTSKRVGAAGVAPQAGGEGRAGDPSWKEQRWSGGVH